MFRFEPCRQRIDIGLIRYVKLLADHMEPFGPKCLRRLLARRFVTDAEHHLGPLAGKRAADFEADAAIATRHDRDASVEIDCHAYLSAAKWLTAAMSSSTPSPGFSGSSM